MKGIKINWKAIPDAFKLVGKYGKDHAPSILVGLGIISLGATVYFTADAAPKAKQAIERAEDEADLQEGEELKTIEKVKIAAPYYIPAAVFGGITIGCNLAAQKINLSRLSSLGAMYAIARNDLKEIKDKIIETDGQKKLDNIEYNVSKESALGIDDLNIYDTGRGNTIYIDIYARRAFKTSPTEINNALTAMNTRLMVDGECELRDFLYDLGVPWSNANFVKNAVFRANTATDVINQYQIVRYVHDDDANDLACLFEGSKICVLDYANFLCPSWDFDARMNKYD